MTQTVHLVIGCDSESETVLHAFTTAESASECLVACRKHQGKRPAYPSVVEDTPENDAAFEKADAAFNRWCERHPGGDRAWVYDCFRYQVMALRTRFSSGKRRADQA